MCNLKCSFCPRGHDYPNQDLHMTIDTIDLLYNRIKSFCQINSNIITISLSGRSEPALHKNYKYLLTKIIELKEHVDVNIRVNTNGLKFDNYLAFYEKFDIVQLNIYDNNTYEYFISNKEKYSKYKNIKTYWRSDDYVEVGKLKYQTKYTNRAGGVETNITTNSFHDSRCDKPINQIFIDQNGDFNLCPQDWGTKKVLSNIKDTSIEDYVLHNKELREIRKSLARGKRKHLPCSKCNYEPVPSLVKDINNYLRQELK